MMLMILKNFGSQFFFSWGNKIAVISLGCPREHFLAMISGNLPETVWFLQAYKNAYYTQHIKQTRFSRAQPDREIYMVEYCEIF